jgi:NAD(P)-dependent dehydrogenase (short-subunit alcohol dehydrogenase family)
MTDRPLEGRLALVTGASRGIGAATALALGGAGAHVVLTARTDGALQEVEDRIFEAGGTATIAPLDLLEQDHIGRLAQAIAGRWKSLDLLVLNAATLGSLTPVAHAQAAEFDRVMALNVTANHRLLAAFDPLLRASGDARVIGITSGVATSPRAYWGPYAASKAALEALLAAYAQETENVSRIKVAVLNPGATRTAMRARAFPGEDPAMLKGPEAVADRILALATENIPTGTRVSV